MTPYHFCYVYVLKSVRYAKLYIGYTRDLRKRLSLHNAGTSTFTNRFKPWALVYYEAFSNPMAAKARESSLKHNGNPMRELKKRIGLADAKVVRGFTLIETLVAITLLSVAIVAPMALAAQSLATAYYARDQITAFYLAQEAIESVRAIRDAQILKIAQSTGGSGIDLFGPIPLGNQPFTIDSREIDPEQAIAPCEGACGPLQTDGTLYGYNANWADSNFTRTVKAALVGSGQGELRLSVAVTWKTGAFQERSFSISENLYRWVNDSSAAQ